MRLPRLFVGVACARAEVTVMRTWPASRWRASDSASGKYLSRGAVAISTGAVSLAADRSGDNMSTTRRTSSGSAA